MKTFQEFLTETTDTIPPPQYGSIDDSCKDWAQDKLSSAMQWNLDQINVLDIYANKEQIDACQRNINTIKKYMQ